MSSGHRARYMVLHLPAFRTERCGYPATTPVGLLAERQNALRLVALSPAARAEGLTLFMTATEARAYCAMCELVPFEPQAEANDYQALLTGLTRFSDRVMPFGVCDVAIDISRLTQLYPCERALLNQVRNHVVSLGHLCLAAIADDPAVAWALACFGPKASIVSGDQQASALAPLPVEALRPSPALLDALQSLGIRRIGQWARLDPASVTVRYGQEGDRLHRLARGQVVSQVPAKVPKPACFCETVVLGGPTETLGPILFVLPGLLTQLGQQLDAHGRQVVCLALRFGLDRGPAMRMRIRVGAPTANPDRLMRLVRARLERVQLRAPVVELHIEAEETTLYQGLQPSLLDRSLAVETLPNVLATLRDTLGESSVVYAKLVEDWRPESAWKAGSIDKAPPRVRTKLDPVERLFQFERTGPGPRPTVLIRRPERLLVQGETRPEALNLGGVWYRCERSAGPERLEGRWYTEPFGRDYWVVQINQRTAWIFRNHCGAWYMHGWFD